jgi:hypothetical protein
MNQGIPFDGFKQVVEMLQHADAAFREKILRNIAAKDPQLAARLLAATRGPRANGQSDRLATSSAQLERSQRALNTKNYGL